MTVSVRELRPGEARRMPKPRGKAKSNRERKLAPTKEPEPATESKKPKSHHTEPYEPKAATRIPNTTKMADDRTEQVRCLRCGREFMSWDRRRNRLCEACTAAIRDQSIDEPCDRAGIIGR